LSRLPAGYHPQGCRIGSNVRRIARVYGREQASRAYITEGVDGRGRYGNEVGNSLRNKRRTDEGGRGCKPEELIRGGQGLAEG
jgi:hypothetical protein